MWVIPAVLSMVRQVVAWTVAWGSVNHRPPQNMDERRRHQYEGAEGAEWPSAAGASMYYVGAEWTSAARASM